ncbi:hypothetical protein G6F38_009894 [Rhizopus arrhizus]|nr:hypothetical protein G6F38_009894 [Rhizopus arrhizus]
MLSLNKGPYVLGEKITYVDFFIYHILDDDIKTIVDIEAEAHIDAETYPHVATFIEAFKNRPNLKGSIALQIGYHYNYVEVFGYTKDKQKNKTRHNLSAFQFQYVLLN